MGIWAYSLEVKMPMVPYWSTWIQSLASATTASFPAVPVLLGSRSWMEYPDAATHVGDLCWVLSSQPWPCDRVDIGEVNWQKRALCLFFLPRSLFLSQIILWTSLKKDKLRSGEGVVSVCVPWNLKCEFQCYLCSDCVTMRCPHFLLE